MPCETPVCRPQSFASPPCARREPLQKPVTIGNQLYRSSYVKLSKQTRRNHEKSIAHFF